MQHYQTGSLSASIHCEGFTEGQLQTNTYILRHGQVGEMKDNPGLLYHQIATEDL